MPGKYPQLPRKSTGYSTGVWFKNLLIKKGRIEERYGK
jgi:hypothetical protein